MDTFSAAVASEAVAAGAHLVNDVSGGSLDPDMHATVSSSQFADWFDSLFCWQAGLCVRACCSMLLLLFAVGLQAPDCK